MSPFTPEHQLKKKDKAIARRINHWRNDDRRYKWNLHEKYGAICWYCGIDIPAIRQRTVDHVIPLAELAKLDPPPKRREVALACIPCNGAKGNRSVDEFHEWIRHIRSDKFQNYMGYENPSIIQVVFLKIANTLRNLGAFNLI